MVNLSDEDLLLKRHPMNISHKSLDINYTK